MNQNNYILHDNKNIVMHNQLDKQKKKQKKKKSKKQTLILHQQKQNK